jgi:Protein of unknown function (DUF5672)
MASDRLGAALSCAQPITANGHAMMYPYAEFLIDFDRKHGNLRHQNCPENTRAAVIIEARPFFFLPKVIRNTMFFLGPRWNLHIFCGELSHAFVQECFRDWNVSVTKFPHLGRLTVNGYNGVLTSPRFWESFREDRILVFQSDSILSADNVEDFAAFDFVGAPCGRFDEGYVANGGLSLRSRRLMLDCLSRSSYQPGLPEDVFFTKCVREMGVPMPDMKTATRFAVESLYTSHPVGVHGTDKCYHAIDVAERITRAIQY